MRRNGSRQKLITIIVIITVMVFSFYGLYRMAINRAAEEISRVLETLDGVHEDNTDKTPSEISPPEERLISDIESESSPPQQDRDHGSKDDSQLPIPSPQDPDKPGDEDPPPGQDDDDQEPQKKHALFGYMPVDDQKYLIDLSNRFSLGEIRSILDSYQAGGESWETSKSIIQERVSPEEISRVNYLVNKYML